MNDISVFYPSPSSEKPINEFEILGISTWFWHEDKYRKTAELWKMMTFLLPPIKHKQFAIFYADKKPIGYVSWANLSYEKECIFLHDEGFLGLDCWASGNRTWIVDFFAPGEYHKEIFRILRTELFPNGIGRYLSRRKKEQNILKRIFTVRGMAVDSKELKYWIEKNPVAEKRVTKETSYE